MTSSDCLPTASSLIALLILSSLTLVSTQSDPSACPTNKNSTCTALPFDINNPPDVWLSVPNLSVDRISLIVENLTAQVSLTASVAGLVSINAGVDVSIDKVNLTIAGTIRQRRALRQEITKDKLNFVSRRESSSTTGCVSEEYCWNSHTHNGFTRSQSNPSQQPQWCYCSSHRCNWQPG